jgi:hypothetical protein
MTYWNSEIVSVSGEGVFKLPTSYKLQGPLAQGLDVWSADDEMDLVGGLQPKRPSDDTENQVVELFRVPE